MSTLNVASINSGPIGGSRNAIINGNPTINQRGYVSGTATSGANQYTLDRWRVVTSGQSITWTDSANVRTVTAPAGGVEQVIEGVNLGTGTYTLSWTGTATATVAGVSAANGATVSVTGGVDLTVRFIGGTFSLAQLEPGTRATPFERRSYGQELALCQRYFQKTYNQSVVPGTDTANGALLIGDYNGAIRALGQTFLTPLRAGPTLNIWDKAGNVNRYSSYDTAWNNNLGSVSTLSAGESSFLVIPGSASGVATSIHYTASAEL